MQFHAVDLYSAIPSSSLCPSPALKEAETALREAESVDEEGSEDPKQPPEDRVIYHLENINTFKHATEEIKRCHSLSAGPNFIVSALADEINCFPLQMFLGLKTKCDFGYFAPVNSSYNGLQNFNM